MVDLSSEALTLEGAHVRLEPLSLAHVAVLSEVALDPSLWRWNPRAPLKNADDMRRYVESALQQQAAGEALPFATFSKSAQRFVGSTRFHRDAVGAANRAVEIGYSWIAPPWQRSAVNSEAKLLMLSHAFEVWRCVRVQIRTDALNEKSRNAILRLGATYEGALRSHMLTWNGRRRDTLLFSILDSEWPEVRQNLHGRLAAKLAIGAT